MRTGMMRQLDNSDEGREKGEWEEKTRGVEQQRDEERRGRKRMAREGRRMGGPVEGK